MAFMRHNNNGRRHNNNNRHRPNNGQGNNGQNQRRHVNRINQVFESNGPEGRVRGTAAQIVEKYMGLARDAQVSGDRVLSMNYFQHAEHYQRLLTEINEENAVFERERDAQRAAQQSQPDISATDAEQGFVEASVGMDEQPREQRQHHHHQEQRHERRFEPRQQRPQREPRAQVDDSDLNTLPEFLQVPITSTAPQTEAPAEAAAKPRTPRPRRASTPSEE